MENRSDQLLYFAGSLLPGIFLGRIEKKLWELMGEIGQ
jgi:hypothetical protein